MGNLTRTGPRSRLAARIHAGGVRSRRLRILTEASGSLISAYIIKAIQEAGHIAVASDVETEIAGRFLAADFIEMPRKSDPRLWEKTRKLLQAHRVDMVIPSFDEMLLGWATRRQELLRRDGVHVVVSPPQTVEIFRDKWRTYQCFKRHHIPTPATSLSQKYPLVKPRAGRGSVGITVPNGPVAMRGMVSQELLAGDEYTVDVFCDARSVPVYIVPRKRLGVCQGKSTGGVVVDQPEIARWVRVLCQATPFRGPINLQCFVGPDGAVRFTEVNPRLAGGMALAFAATENWIRLAVDHFVLGKPIRPKPVAYGTRMLRYYAEVFVPGR